MSGSSHTTIGLLAAAAVVCILAGLSIPEQSRTGGHDQGAWGGVAVAAALLTASPLIAATLHWTAERAAQLAWLGAGILGVHWILFVLPAISRNTSLALTAGVVLGGLAAWWGPSRSGETSAANPSGRSLPGGPSADRGGPPPGPGPHQW